MKRRTRALPAALVLALTLVAALAGTGAATPTRTGGADAPVTWPTGTGS